MNLFKLNIKQSLLAFFALISISAISQDDCATAVPVLDLTGTVCATSAPSLTDQLSAGGCEEGTLDTWFSFTAQGGTADITVSNGTAGWRPEYVLLSDPSNGCVALFTQENCVDALGNYNSISNTEVGLIAGNTYWIVVSSNGDDITGTISVCVDNPLVVLSCVDNDECLTAAAISLNGTGGAQACISDCNNGATPGLDFGDPTVCGQMLNPTVWYTITTDAATATIDIDLSSVSDLSNPEFAIFTDNGCGTTWTTVSCVEGALGTAAATGIPVTASTTYIIAISDASGDQGNFDLCITENPDNSACNTNQALTVSATSMGSPLAGPYQPGETVSFCYTITDWTQFNCNYIGAVVPTFGDCWDPASFDLNGTPVNITTPLNVVGVIQPCPPGPPCQWAACAGQPSGSWNWFNAGSATYNVNGYYPINTPMPAGWYFLSSYDPLTGNCAPDPTDPDDSYGDGDFPDCGTNTFDYTMCFDLIAGPVGYCGAGNTDCTVSIKTFADGEFGAWNNLGCTSDIPMSAPSSLLCCPTFTNPGDQFICDSYTFPTILGVLLTGNEAYYTGAGGTGTQYNATDIVNFADFPSYPTTIYIYDAVCGSEISFQLTIGETPTVTFTAPADLCIDAGVQVGLGGGAVAGGIYSGPGVTDNGNGLTYDFDPAAAGAGIHTITYTVITLPNPPGCTAFDTDDVEVFALPVVTFTAPADLCIDAGVQATLGGGTPVGGVYSGTGVTDNGNGTDYDFDPAAAGIGTHTITYTYTDGNGCTAFDTDDVEVFALPVVTFTAPADLCIDAGVQATLGGGTPVGGVYSGTGVTDNGNGTDYDFDPAAAGIGIHTITYTYTDINGCTSFDTDDIEVFALPVVTFTAPADLCIDAGVQVALGGGTPVGGVYSGPGVTDNGNGTDYDFDPAAAGAGIHTITYTYTDVNGCTAFDTDDVEVFALPVVTFTAPVDLCIDAGVQVALGGGTPVGGVYSGTGVTDNGNGTDYDFDPAAAGAGIHTITYTYTDVNGCTAFDTDDIEVFALPVVTFTAPADLCIDAGVQVALGGGTPVGGVYSGTGVTDNGNGTDYDFDPAAAGAGIHTITYTYTDINGCTAFDTDDIEVFALPVVTFTAPADLCIDAGVQVALGGGTPVGGVYSGTGVTDNGNGTDYDFDPAAAGAGIHTITYTYTDINGCTSFDTDDVEVFALPVVTFTAPADLCIDAGVQVALGGGTPVGGVYSGTGVTDNGNGTDYDFDPAAAGVGIHTITYTYTDINGCTSFDTDDVEVFALPVVTFTAPVDLCIDAGVQLGLAGGTPIGGVYSGTGVTDNGNGLTYSFDPAAAGVGIHTITYTFTDVNGCTSFDTDDVEIFALPLMSTAQTPLTGCDSDDGIITVSGGGATGTVDWTGPASGTSGSVTLPFDITALASGTYDVTFTDGTTGCTSIISQESFINPGAPIIDPIASYAACNVDFTLLNANITGTLLTGGQAYYTATGGPSGAGSLIPNGTVYTAPTSITIYVFDENGTCSSEEWFTVEVFAIPVVTFTAPADLCIDAGVQATLGGATPAGGIYSGPGVTDNGNGTDYDFDPAAAGVGIHTIQYDYTDGNGCSNSITDDVEVFALPVVTFTAPADLCIDAGVQATLGGGTPVGGVYSGTGVTDNGNGTDYDFDPAAAGVGTHTITYTYTDGNGCTAFDTDDVEVFALPVVTFTAPADLCIDAGVQATLGGGTPVGGVYSGTGVTDNGNGTDYDFDPAAAGIGTHTITYTYTDGNGCTAFDTDDVEVFAIPVVTFTAPVDLCIDAGVQATLGGGTPVGGVYSGTGVTDNGNGTDYDFDPAAAGVGIHTITYTYTDVNGCTAFDTDDVEVFALPVVTFTAPADLCIDAGVQATLGGGTPVGGVYSGTGVTDNGNGTDYDFDPAAAGVGIHTITYTYTDVNGCTSFDTDDVEVFALPVVTFTAPADLCIDAGVQATLGGGTPVGGVYSGTGVTDNGNGTDYDFDPAAAGVGTHTITYTYTDGNGCTVFDTDDVEVFALPVVTFTAPADLCIDAGVQATLGGGTPVGGVYSGTGVTDNGNGTDYDFDPAAAGVGTHTITYTYTDGNGCTAFDTDDVEVFALPVISTVQTPLTGCNTNDGIITVADLGGATGTVDWTGTASGTSGSVTLPYDITSLAPGTYDVTFTDGTTNCTTVLSQETFTNPGAPVIDPLADVAACSIDFIVAAITGTNLTGNEAYYDAPGGPTGGGAVVPVGTVYSPGTSITLYMFDENGVCSSEESFTVNLYASPDVDVLADQEQCDTYLLPVITGTNLTGNEAYYTGAAGTGTQYLAGVNITATIALFIYDETGTIPNCIDEESFNIIINLSPVINLQADLVECDSVQLPAITGTNLTGNESFFDGIGGTGNSYNTGDWITSSMLLYIYDEIGTATICSDETSFQITITSGEDPSFTISDFCEGDLNSANVTGMVGGLFTFSPDLGDGSSINITTGEITNGIGGTTYNIQYATSTSTCADSLTLTVTVEAIPNAPTAGSNAVYCSNINPANLTASGSGGTFTWYDDASSIIGTGSTFAPFSTVGITNYYVLETSTFGCVGPTSMVTITINDCDLIIPTAITPGINPNQVWEIINLDSAYPNNIVTIYNRWGNLIFENESDPSNPYSLNPWDGTFNGDVLPVASYYFIIQFNDGSGDAETGTVTIIRN